jgi:hypothetical protein
MLLAGRGGSGVAQADGAQGMAAPVLSREMDVRRVSAPLVEADPGEIVTLSFRVENLSGQPQRVQEQLTLPVGWHAVFPPTDFFLEVGESTVRLVGVQPGTRSAGGAQRIRYSVVSLISPAIRGEADAEVRLREVSALALLSLGDASIQTFAGETTDVMVRVINQGNTALDITCALRLDFAGEARVIPQALSVLPGGSEILHVTLRANASLVSATRGTLTLVASTDHQVAGRPVGARLHLQVEAIPIRAGESVWRHYPLTLSSALTGDFRQSGDQFTVQGDGYLDGAHRRRLQVMARGPDRRGRNLFAQQQDEYWGALELPRAYVTAGDRAFTLSELTAQSRYGRGGGLEFSPFRSPLTFSGFYVADRLLASGRTDWGSSLAIGTGRPSGSFRSPARQEFRVNFLAMDWAASDAAPAYQERIGTVEGRVALRGVVRVDGELARSESSARGGRVGDAWRVRAAGRVGPAFEYRVQGRHADPAYAGRFFDSADYESFLGFPLGWGLRGSLLAQRYERNLEVMPTRGTANRENLYRGTVDLPLRGRLRVSLDYQFYQRDDARSAVVRNVEQHRTALRVSQARRSFSYAAEVRISDASHRAQDEERRSSGLSYSADINFRPSARFSISGHASLGRDDVPRDSRLGREAQTYSGMVSWSPGRRLRLQAQYAELRQRVSDEPVRERQGQDHYGVGVDLRVTDGQSLRADVRRAESRLGVIQSFFNVTYQLRLGVPIARRGSVGRLSGQATLRTATGEVPLAHAVVRVGQTATRTDDEGRFHFRTLPEGMHPIRVEASALNARTVPEPGQPTTVQVQTHRSSHDLRLSFVEGATVRGRLEFAPPLPELDLERPGGAGAASADCASDGPGGARCGRGADTVRPLGEPLPSMRGVLVELVQNSDVRRTLTDPDGNFLFQRLAAGNWLVRVYPQGLPPRSRLQRETSTVFLQPGDETRVIFYVVPLERRIRFQDGGHIETVPTAPARDMGTRPGEDAGGRQGHDAVS